MFFDIIKGVVQMKKSLIRRKKFLKDMIYSENTRSLCRLPNDTNSFTRNRKISYFDLLLLTLNKQGKNTSFEIRDYEINKKGENKVNYTDEAYLKQRRHLNPEVFKIMNKGYLKDFYNDKKYIIKNKGYIILAIDGSKDEIPNTPQNRKEFGEVGNNQAKHKVARALFSGIYDVYNHFFIDTQVSNVNNSEIELAKKNIEACMEIIEKNNILIVLDRGYPSIEFFDWLNERNIKFLIRLSPNDYIKERKNMETSDEEVNIEYTYARMNKLRKKHPDIYEKIKDKKEIKMRIVNIEIAENTTESLITNIFDNDFKKEDFKKIYNDRWKIERAYDSLKNKLKIEKFTGNLPIFVYQDIYAQVLVYNQIQDILYTGNQILRKNNNKKKLKLEYNINENKAIGLYKEKFIKIMLIENKDEAIKEFDKLIEELTKYTSAVRKGRKSNPRNWNTSNKYRKNMSASF